METPHDVRSVVSDLLAQAQERIASLEEQIRQAEHPKGPAPELKLPGGPPSRGNRVNQDFVASLRQEIEDVKLETQEKVEKTLTSADAQTKADLSKSAKDTLYPDKSAPGRDTAPQRTTEKDLSASQRFAMNERYSSQKLQEPSPTQNKDFAGKGVQSKQMSMSARFNQGLSYTRAMEDAREPSREDHVRDKEDPDRDKD